MKVTFTNVGRNKATWTAECKELSYDWLYGQVKSRGAIMSRGVEFDYDEATKNGSVWVGDVRKVGEFSTGE